MDAVIDQQATDKTPANNKKRAPREAPTESVVANRPRPDEVRREPPAAEAVRGPREALPPRPTLFCPEAIFSSGAPGNPPFADQPVAAPPAPCPSPAPPAPPERQALLMERSLLPSMLATALGMDRYFTAAGYRAFLDQVRKDAGNPTDPVEVMLLEQLVLAHYRAAQLQANAGQAEGLEAVRLYNAAAARLLAEFRQTALALKAYREPAPGRDGGPGPVDPGSG